MALAQSRPISIPAAPSSPTSSSKSHFRCSSDQGSELSISLPHPAANVFPFSAVQDPFAATQLLQRLACFSAQDVLSCSSSTRSRLVVCSETANIESAGERLAEADDAETWVILRRASETHASAGMTKLLKSDCAGLLGPEDLSVFFAAVFAPTKLANARPSSSPHLLASPPASPNAGSSRFSFSEEIRTKHAEPRANSIRAHLDSRKAVPASLVSNLSGKNSLHHVSLGTSLLEVLLHLSQDNFNCVVVSDLRNGDDGAVCGILTAADVVAFLVEEADKDTTLATVFSNKLDTLASSVLQQPATVISGDRSTVDALVRMQSEQLSVLAVVDPLGGLISPVSSREISQEILRSSSRKILTTPLSSLVKELRSRHPQGTDGKDAHPAISVSSSSTVGRAAALLLATEAGGVFVVDEPRVIMTPPLSCVSTSPSKELPYLTLDADFMPLNRSTNFTPAPAQKHRRSSTQFWTTPRSSFSAASNDACSRPSLPNFAVGGSIAVARERRASHKPESALSSSVSSLPCKNASTTMPAHLRIPSGPRTHRPRSLSLAQFSIEESAMARQFGAYAMFRAQGTWTSSTLTPSSSASSAGSPSSPLGNMLASGFFGEVMPSGMPRHVVTMKTILRSVLAAVAASSEEAVDA
ncbi:uncharacterized protein MEPE_01080 [Melanopsichium pennsylvanicum]|uniref:CBS domain-containing protein n=2 Tax=Melanopsichium pennsylvanicum TaxID=63383 RepID=A0AAJ4XH22_9BASI|nr:putative protein [Melanopsichium pennsylvanicum 4]SNX82374.1 uncharacterized protein MEPE_01080 [Melanopsichium pennsylvanicum]